MLCFKAQGFLKKRKKRHKMTMMCCLQSRITNPTRLEPTRPQFNSLFEHTGSVRELYISLHFIQNTDTDKHSRSHPLTGARHIQVCTVAINMYVGMHTLGSNAVRNASHGKARWAALEMERRLYVSPSEFPKGNKHFFTVNKSCRALGGRRAHSAEERFFQRKVK